MYTCKSHQRSGCKDAVCRRQAEREGLVTPTPSKRRAQQIITNKGLVVAGAWDGYAVLEDGRRGSLAHLSDCSHLNDSVLDEHDRIPAQRAIEAIRELRTGASVEADGGRVAVRLCQSCDARLV